MVAAEHQGEVTAAHDALYLSARHRRRAGDLRQVAGAYVPHLQLLHVLDGDVALVDHGVAELAQAVLDARDPDGGRPHVHPAPARAEVHGDAEDVDDHAPNLGRRTSRVEGLVIGKNLTAPAMTSGVGCDR